MRPILPVLAATACLLGAHAASAAVVFQDALVGTQQVPPVVTTATGSATVILQSDDKTLDVSLTWSGLTSDGTFGHIHCCTSLGSNASVAIPFAGLPTTASGSFTQSYDLSTFTFANGLTQAAFIAGLEAGRAYVNIHDTAYPNGEIRAQLTPVPEPTAAWLLAGASLAAFTVARRRIG